jgi:hypothetical protein
LNKPISLFVIFSMFQTASVYGQSQALPETKRLSQKSSANKKSCGNAQRRLGLPAAGLHHCVGVRNRSPPAA